jgi:site-specific recombinase XerD
LTFLGRLQVPDAAQPTDADHVRQYSDFLFRERGLSPQTVAYRQRTIHQFLAQVEEAGLRLKTVTVAQVDELLIQKVRDEGYARVTIKSWVSALRPFFRFAEERGWCRRGLAAAIKGPRVYKHQGLPIGPSWEDVKRLLAAAEGDRPADIRDRALMLLLAVYGLRAGEVTTLRLKDFDWEREVLHVARGKGNKPRTYPLCRPVGDAVLRYLSEVRPRSDRREVFLTLVAPFTPLAVDGLGEAVRRRLHALGLKLPHYGSHVLRHACATHLLAQGLSLKEIGDHLGHQSPEATRIYAKVDLAALRMVGDFALEGLL